MIPLVFHRRFGEKFLLFFVEIPGLLAEVSDGFVEAGGCGVAKIFAEVFELAFGSGTFGYGF
ncbi:MAG UNVERIFIED_CONTAM: hypothetical protein LVR18_08575 [Planctomycetaceae bacterium]